jgi:predicted DNA-binding transcriptional regulator AlpA
MTGKQQRPGPNDLPAPPEQTRTLAADGAVDSGEDQSPHAEKSSYHAAASRSALVGRGMTADELLSLPAAFPFDPVVPAAFGISRSAAYRALAVGQLPVQPIKLGRKLVVKRSDLLAALGIEDRSSAALE